MKTVCDWRRHSNSFWYSSYDYGYEDTLYIEPSPLPTQRQTIATVTASCSEQLRTQSAKSSRQEPATFSLSDEHTLKET